MCVVVVGGGGGAGEGCWRTTKVGSFPPPTQTMLDSEVCSCFLLHPVGEFC